MIYQRLFSITFIIFASIILSACQQNVADKESLKTDDTNQDETNIATPSHQSNNLNTEQTSTSYDIENWKKQPIKKITLNNLQQIQNSLGKVTSTDDKSLDYASHTAIKYRFMNGDMPYLDIIDSDDYLEIGWYFANENSNEQETKISINHAKKAYQLARQLMGQEGGDMVQSILSGQIIKNRDINGYHIELAKCEFYGCMYIINKNKTTNKIP